MLLQVEVGKFQHSVCATDVTIDRRYNIGRDRITWKSKHKLGKYYIEATDLLKATTKVRIEHNLPGKLLIPEVIESLLRYRFGLFGYPVVHACAFERRKRGVLLTGRGGIGKTTTAVRLLQENETNLIGDNWIPMVKGRIFPFPTSFNLSKHNISLDIWGRLTVAERSRYFLYTLISQLTYGRIRPFLEFSVAREFPNRIAQPVPVDLIFLILPSESFAIEPTVPDLLIQQWVAINQMDCPSFTAATFAYRCVDPKHPFASHWDTLAENLQANFPSMASCYVVHLPRDYPVESYSNLMDFIDKEL
jgi:hypothetical protein